MSDTRTAPKFSDELAELTTRVNTRLGMPIKEQQDVTNRIIAVGKYLDAAFKIATQKVDASSGKDVDLNRLITELSKPEHQLDYLHQTFIKSSQEIESNKPYAKEAQIKLNELANIFKDKKMTDPALPQDKAKIALDKLQQVIAGLDSVISQQENYKTKIPQLIAKLEKDKATLYQQLKITNTTNLQQNIGVTLHGKSQGKATASPVEASSVKRDISKQKGT